MKLPSILPLLPGASPALLLSALALGLTGCLDAAAAPSTGAPARPNILFILADDLDMVTFNRTERLRPLLQEKGTEFVNSFVSISLCCPSRSTMLRGQYAHNTRILHNFPPDGGFRGFQKHGCEQSTLGTWFQGQQVRTGFFGKYLNGYPEEDAPLYVPPGWDEWFVPSRGAAYDSFDYVVNHNGQEERFGSRPSDHVTDVVTDEAERFIRKAARKDEPFFAWVSLYAPHLPATPPPRHAGAFAGQHAPHGPAWNEEDMSDKPVFQDNPPLGDAWVEGIDAAWRKRSESMLGVADSVERLLGALEDTGALANTWVVFNGDNGFHYGDHRLPWGKNTPYETDLRVPLVVRGPGVPAGRTVELAVVNHDLAPTFGEIAGVAVPDFVDGRSWMALALGQTPTTWRQGFLLEHRSREDAAALGRVELAAGQRAPRKPKGGNGAGAAADETLGAHEGDPLTRTVDEPADMAAIKGLKEYEKEWPSYVGLRSDQYKYVRYADGARELYDLRADPAELQNLAMTADPDLLARLDRWTDALRDCQAEACRKGEDRGLEAAVPAPASVPANAP